MILAAMFLITLGVVMSLMGIKLFRLLLPLFGFVSGTMVGFMGFQGIFGKGAVSSALAVVVAVIVGIIMALLSFVFFDLAAVLFTALLGATAFSYLGVALGLDKQGFLVFMMGVAGAILTATLAARYALSARLVVTLTSFLGVAYILTGLMLVVGSVSLNEINNTGIIPTLLSVVDQSFLWFFVWIGGALVAVQLQYRVMVADTLKNIFEYAERNPINAKR